MHKGTPTNEKDIFKIDSNTYRIRVRRVDPKTGKPTDNSRLVTSQKAREAGHTGRLLDFAVTVRLSLISALDQSVPDAARTTFKDWAKEVMETRMALGKIVSPETKDKWTRTLDNHLLKDWGDAFVDAITRSDIQRWLVKLGLKIQAGTYTPSTVKTWWAVFRAIMTRAAAHFDIKDPTLAVELPSDYNHRTYTTEEPNSLLPAELPAFFDAAWTHEREHFAMLALGMLTGRRACELRPLRREGRYADLRWETGQLLIRRSQTKGEPMEVTKTKRDVVLFLPESLLDVLRTHIANLTPYRKSSDLLFPPRMPMLAGAGTPNVGYMSKSALDKPIRNICEKAGIKKHLTAKGAMRRTYQDLCDAAHVDEVVKMAMSGHATKKMMLLYSTADMDRKRSALTRMSDIAGLAKAARLT